MELFTIDDKKHIVSFSFEICSSFIRNHYDTCPFYAFFLLQAVFKKNCCIVRDKRLKNGVSRQILPLRVKGVPLFHRTVSCTLYCPHRQVVSFLSLGEQRNEGLVM